MNGKIIIVTGASAGIGKETSIDLIKNGTQVIIACWNELKAKGIIKNLNKKKKT